MMVASGPDGQCRREIVPAIAGDLPQVEFQQVIPSWPSKNHVGTRPVTVGVLPPGRRPVTAQVI